MNNRLDIVDGELLVDEFAPTRIDRDEIVAEARAAAHELARRAGV